MRSFEESRARLQMVFGAVSAERRAEAERWIEGRPDRVEAATEILLADAPFPPLLIGPVQDYLALWRCFRKV